MTSRPPLKRSSISTLRCLFGKIWNRASVWTFAKRGSVMTSPLAFLFPFCGFAIFYSEGRCIKWC